MASLFSTTSQIAAIDTRVRPGTITLPLTTASLYRQIMLKDLYGAFPASTLTISTQLGDYFEDGTTTRILSNGYEFQALYSGSTSRWHTVAGTRWTSMYISSLRVDSLQLGSGDGWADFGPLRATAISTLQTVTGYLQATSISTLGLSTGTLTACNISVATMSTNYGFFSSISAGTYYGQHIGDASLLTNIPNNGAVLSVSNAGVTTSNNLTTVSNSGVTDTANIGTVSNSVVTNMGYLTTVSNSGVTNTGNITTVSNSVVTNMGYLTTVSNSGVTNTGNITAVSNAGVTTSNNLTTVSNTVAAGRFTGISTNTISTNLIIAGNVSSPQGYISSLTVDSLTFGFSNSYMSMGDIITTSVSTIQTFTSTLITNNLQVGTVSSLSYIAFPGLQQGYAQTVIAEQATATGVQELLIFRGSTNTDRIRMQTTGTIVFEPGVSARTFPATGSNATPAMIITTGSNVGIGVAAPTVSLDVAGAGRFTALSVITISTNTIYGQHYGDATNLTSIPNNGAVLTVSNNVTTLSNLLNSVSTNTTSVSTNLATISNLLNSVSTNATNVSTNVSAVSNLLNSVSTNATNVSTNVATVSNLLNAVSTNATNVSTNVATVSNLLNSVSTNATNVSTNVATVSNLLNSVSTNATSISTNLATVSNTVLTGRFANISTNTISTNLIIAGYVSSPQGYISSLTVDYLAIGSNYGYVNMGDIIATSMSSLAIQTQTLTTGNLQVGTVSSLSYIAFPGLQQGYTQSVVAEQSTGTGLQELLIFRGSTTTDRIRMQTTGSIIFEPGVSARVFPAAPSNVTPAMIITTGSNVGIGITAPGVSLDVAGAGRFTAVSVNTISTNFVVASNISTNSMSTNYGFFSTISVGTMFGKYVGDGSGLTGISGGGGSSAIPAFVSTNTLSTGILNVGFISSISTVTNTLLAPGSTILGITLSKMQIQTVTGTTLLFTTTPGVVSSLSGINYILSNSGMSQVSIPIFASLSPQGQYDGSFMTLRNATASYLTLTTMTCNVNASGYITIPPANSVTLAYSPGNGYYGWVQF